MAGSRKTRADAGEGFNVAALSPAVSVSMLSVRKERRSLFSIDRADEEVDTADREVTEQLEKPLLLTAKDAKMASVVARKMAIVKIR
mmetsp:Transcript_33826/g.57453  ORF Transcript_33826/g.57453 Transcript_33826/m.57453 type:complete len:87 (+) Transcript_33826:289-549(+)